MIKLNENEMPSVKEYYTKSISDEKRKNSSKVLDLIEGFESPYGLELLATVDFVACQTENSNLGNIQKEISNWTTRKKKIMKSFHIEVARKRLLESFLITEV